MGKTVVDKRGRTRDGFSFRDKEGWNMTKDKKYAKDRDVQKEEEFVESE